MTRARCQFAWVIAAAFAVALFAPATSEAATSGATAAGATIVGTVVDQRNSLPIGDAAVQLLQNGTVAASTATDQFGNFSMGGLAGGVYDVRIAAKGYAPSSLLNVAVAAGATIAVNAALVQALNLSSVHTIGTVTVSAQALASATTITQVLNTQNVSQTGQIRIADQLATLPAINFSTSSSPGDDATVDMRGFGSSETATLLDSRPVGPLGVGAPDNFNFADTPVMGLTSADVTYGSGALGLYGSDTIAGAVDMHLLTPTIAPQYTFQQQIGGFGISSSALGITGTAGKIGYVAAAGRAGQTGSLNGMIFQSARPANLTPGAVNPPYLCSNFNGNDVSACNQGAETYSVGQQTNLESLVGKLNYAINDRMALQLSGFSSVQWANSTGNGDNDYLPYATRVNQILNGSAPDCSLGGGNTTNGYGVIVDPGTWNAAGQPAPNPTGPAGPGMTCLTAKQWALVSYGPDGGGADRNRGTAMRDYDARYTVKIGANNNVALDYYVNNYVYHKDSSLAGGLGPDGARLGTPVFADFYNTHGYLISDDITGLNNDLGFGYAILNQLQSGNTLVAVNQNPITGEPAFAFTANFNTALFRTDNFFVRDTHEFGERWSGFLNAWVKRSAVTRKTTFDPRVSAQYRPDSNDVIRLTYGHSDGPPAPLLQSAGKTFQPNPGSSLTSVSCIQGSNSLPNTVGNPNLTSEAADDYEIGYGHRFAQDSNIQVNGYVTHVANEIFGVNLPLLTYGVNNVIFAPGALDLYLSRLVVQGCLPPGSAIPATYPFLAVPTYTNQAGELAKGIEINGRWRFVNRAYIDYGWYVESSQQVGIPDAFLMNNLALVNSAQQNGIPLHQAQVSLDVQPGPFEFRIDNYYVDGNNPLDRPAYWYSNAFISHPFNNGHYILTVGGTNIFNNAVQYYGLIGDGVPQRVNQFAPPIPSSLSRLPPGLAQNLAGIATNEEFGLQPAQLTATLTVRM